MTYVELKQGGNMKTVIDRIYNGAWNNLELSKSAKNSLYFSGGILLLGVIGAYVVANRKQ